MGLLDSIIITGCMSLHGQSHDACVKGLQAGAKQSGVAQKADALEKQQTRSLEAVAYDYIGKDTVEAVGGVGFVTKSAMDKKASINLPNLGVCNKMSLEVNQNTQKLLLEWKF